MNVLSLTASFGARGLDLPGRPPGGAARLHPHRAIEATQPILMLAMAFGLSMDYEVFLLSRVREAWDRTGDNTAAVAIGLQQSGRIITSAARLLVVVIGAFATSGIVFIKMIGVGMVIAIIIDATVVRAMLGAGHHAPARRVELVGARSAGPVLGPPRHPGDRAGRRPAGAEPASPGTGRYGDRHVYVFVQRLCSFDFPEQLAVAALSRSPSWWQYPPAGSSDSRPDASAPARRPPVRFRVMPCSGPHAAIGEQLPLQFLVGDRDRQWPRDNRRNDPGEMGATVLCEMPSSPAIARVPAPAPNPLSSADVSAAWSASSWHASLRSLQSSSGCQRDADLPAPPLPGRPSFAGGRASNGGRLQIGMLDGIRSEWWAPSDQNAWTASLGIRTELSVDWHYWGVDER